MENKQELLSKTVQVIMLPAKQEPKEKDLILLTFEDETTQLGIASNLANDLYYEGLGITKQHLYLVSDTKIKKGDYFLDTKDNAIHKSLGSNSGEFIIIDNDNRIVCSPSYCKKIVATTDNYLGVINEDFKTNNLPKYNNPLPQIPESLIKEYVESKGTIKELEIEIESEEIPAWSGIWVNKIKTNPNNTVIIVEDKKIFIDGLKESAKANVLTEEVLLEIIIKHGKWHRLPSEEELRIDNLSLAHSLYESICKLLHPATLTKEIDWENEHEAFITAMKIDEHKNTYAHLQDAFGWFKERFKSKISTCITKEQADKMLPSLEDIKNRITDYTIEYQNSLDYNPSFDIAKWMRQKAINAIIFYKQDV